MDRNGIVCKKLLLVGLGYEAKSSLRKIFDSSGYEVAEAEDGFKAARLVADGIATADGAVGIALISPDAHSGAAASARTFIESASLHDIPIVAVVHQDADVSLVDEVIRWGASDCWREPLSLEHVLHRIRCILRTSYLEQRERKRRRCRTSPPPVSNDALVPETIVSGSEGEAVARRGAFSPGLVSDAIAESPSEEEEADPFGDPSDDSFHRALLKATHNLIEKDEELARLRLSVSSSLQKPIDVLAKAIKKVGVRAHRYCDCRDTLVDVLRAIASSEVARPVFPYLADNADLDAATRSWLATELAYGERRSSSGSSVDARPASVELPSFLSLPSNKCEEGRRQLSSWLFDIFAYTEGELQTLLFDMFESLGILERFNVPPERLRRLLAEVRELYHRNPYHNFVHAFDITQTVYTFLTNTDCALHLHMVDIFALMFAALCHDLDHPGLNNTYHVNACAALAELYHDQSVLENHHIACAFNLLKRADCNLVEHLTPSERREFRRLVILSILATDMSKHVDITTKLSQRVSTKVAFSKESREDRELLVQVLLHCADISNVVRPFEICKAWAHRVAEEFLAQGDLEREKGLPLSPFMDRDKTALARMEINFIDFVTAPIFAALAQAFPKLRVCSDSMVENRHMWAALLDQQLSVDALRTQRLRWRRRSDAFKTFVSAAMEENSRAMLLREPRTNIRRHSLATTLLPEAPPPTHPKPLSPTMVPSASLPRLSSSSPRAVERASRSSFKNKDGARASLSGSVPPLLQPPLSTDPPNALSSTSRSLSFGGFGNNISDDVPVPAPEPAAVAQPPNGL